MSQKPIVDVQHISRVFGSGEVAVHALRDVTFQIEPAAFIALMGPSGSGKSTLLHAISGLDHVTSGEVHVDGVCLGDLNARELAQLRLHRIGFIFQSYNLLPVLTAYENAEYILLLQGVPAAERRERVMHVLEQVGLKGMEDRFPRQLSGGQQQRVAIARAIVAKPALILADEPTANVDSETATALMQLMESLNREHGLTFVFATHDTNVMRRAHSLIRLKDGQIDYHGPVEQAA